MSLGTDLSYVPHGGQLIAEELADFLLYRRLWKTHQPQPADRLCNTLRSFHALGMVMAYDGTLLCFLKHILPLVEQPSDRTDTHGRPIAERVHGQWMLRMDPAVEAVAVAPHRIRIAAAPVEQALLIATSVEHRIGYSNRADGVVRVRTIGCEKFKSFLWSCSELKA